MINIVDYFKPEENGVYSGLAEIPLNTLNNHGDITRPCLTPREISK